jgi:hypothetical protein
MSEVKTKLTHNIKQTFELKSSLGISDQGNDIAAMRTTLHRIEKDSKELNSSVLLQAAENHKSLKIMKKDLDDKAGSK